MSVTTTVSGLWRFPVKSMLGEALDELVVTEQGVRGDRRYALRDTEGRFGSGKNGSRLRRMDALRDCHARYPGAGGLVPEITFPDGRVLRADDGAVGPALQELVGMDAVLAGPEDGPYFDAASLHVLTTSSLDWLRQRVPDATVDARRMRPNVLVDTGTPAGVVEDGWVGRRLRLGADVVVEVTERTERCAMVTQARAGLEHRPEVLKSIAAGNDLCLGVYARILTGGVVRAGDPVRLE